MQLREYRHGDAVIPMPEREIRIIECGECGLMYKDTLPSPGFLAEVFLGQKGKMWNNGYDFAREVEVIQSLVRTEEYDTLDLGASNGDLLRALRSDGRRSALDIVRYPGLSGALRGEYINGLMDSENLHWSGAPYDIVTAFDVLEHLYSPEVAFANLRRFTKPGGFVVAETGDTASFWPERFGVQRWWYACRFEHHVLWSRDPFERLVQRYGFRIVGFERKRHKERAIMPLWRDLVDVAGIALYRVAPDVYGRLTGAVGKYRPQPWSPFTRDHFRAVLERAI
jgi:SAM-dependent methyltransferase